MMAGIRWVTIAVLAFLSFSATAHAGPQVGEGVADVTASGDPEENAKQEAVRAALRRAIEALVGADALLHNEGTIEQALLRHPDQFVSNVRVVSKRQDGTKLRVTIEAQIDDEQLKQKLTNLRLLGAAVDMPRLMFIYDPQRPYDEVQAGRVETYLIDALTAKKFKVVDPSRAREIGQLARRVTQFSDSPERQPVPGLVVAHDLVTSEVCDVVILYSIEESRPSIAEGFRSYETAVRVRVVTRDRAEVYAANELSERSAKGTEYEAKQSAAQKVAARLSTYLIERITEWWKDQARVMPITLNIYSHNSDLKQVTRLQTRIEKIAKVQSLIQRRIIPGEQQRENWAEYQVNYSGRVSEFLQALCELLEPEDREMECYPLAFGNNVTLYLLDPQQKQRDEAFNRKRAEGGLGLQASKSSVELERIVTQTLPGVVMILLEADLPAEGGARERVHLGHASGFFVSGNGRIVTNCHVVKSKLAGATVAENRIDPDDVSIVVKLADGRERSAAVLLADEERDLAVLKIDADKVTALELGDSDQVKVGHPVIVIGHPLSTSLKSSVSNGIISAVREGKLQTSAITYQGNSGGPMIDSVSGKVIGVQTAGLAAQLGFDPTATRIPYAGVGFAVPVNQVKLLLKTLDEHK